jgi:hypothetical protein
MRVGFTVVFMGVAVNLDAERPSDAEDAEGDQHQAHESLGDGADLRELDLMDESDARESDQADAATVAEAPAHADPKATASTDGEGEQCGEVVDAERDVGGPGEQTRSENQYAAQGTIVGE